MNFTKEYIETLKSSVNIVDYISRYTDLKQNGNVYSGKCPHPGHNDSTPSFRVWENEQSWACMGCHYGSKGGNILGSDIIAFIQWMDNLNFYEAILKLSSVTGIALPDDKESKIYDSIKEKALKYHMNVVVIEKYLISRGLDRDTIRKYKIGYNGKRITIPLIDEYNRYVGFTNRKYSDSSNDVKYINSKNSKHFKKNSFLYNLNNIDYNYNYIVIAEGPFDVIVSSKNGLKNVVSSLGTSLTDNHVDIIKNTGLTPIVCFDGDTAGMNASIKASEKFASKGIFSKIVNLKDGYDLADMSQGLQNKITDYIENESVSYYQYRTNNILNNIRKGINETIIKYYDSLEESIKTIPNKRERESLSSMIYKELGIKI